MEVGPCAGSGCSGTVDGVSCVNAFTFFKFGFVHSVVVDAVHVSVFYFNDVSASVGGPSNVCDNSVCGAFDAEGSAKVNPVMFFPRTIDRVFSHSVFACYFASWCGVLELHFFSNLFLLFYCTRSSCPCFSVLRVFDVRLAYDCFYERCLL